MKKLTTLFVAILMVAVFVLASCAPTITPTPDTPEPPSPPRPGLVNYTEEQTALGIVHRTGTVYDPTDEVEISVFSRGQVTGRNEPGTNVLEYGYEFRANSPETMRTRGGVRHSTVGDVIFIEADYRFVTVEMLGFAPVVLYSPTGEFQFQIPSDGIAREAVVPGGGIGVGSNGVGAMGTIAAAPNWQRPFAEGTFGEANVRNQLDVPRPRSSHDPHIIRASVSTPEEITQSRNLAINPFSVLHVHELNVGTPLGSARQYSRAVESGQVIAFPHAYASRIRTGTDMGSFQPRNAIDGSITTGPGYINYGSHAWDPGTLLDAEFKVYFGRTVTLNSLNLVLRGANGDTHWNSITAVFSNGSSQVINPTGASGRQSFPLTPVQTSYVRLTNLTRDTAGSPVGLTEIEAIGFDSGVNTAAIKTYTINTFQQQEVIPDYRRTNAFNAAELTEALDFAGRDAWTVPFTRVNRQFAQPDPQNRPHEWSQPMRANSTWVDSVLYSALLDAFTTTGNIDHYLAVRYVADSNYFMIRDNEHVRGAQTVGSISGTHLVGETADSLWHGSITDFADCYLIGETYLMMNSLSPAEHKLFSTFVNADANMAISPNWNAAGHWNRGSGFSANLGAGQFNRSNPEGILDWWWCDAIYMGLTFFTNMSNVTGNFHYIEVAFDSYMYWRNILANREDSNPPVYSGSQQFGIMPIEPAGHGGCIGLWHRDTDLLNRMRNSDQTSPFDGQQWPFPAPQNPEGVEARPTFWGRGNGWVFVGIAKTLLALNQDLYFEGNINRFDEIWNEYAADLAIMARTLRHYQREDGTWNVSIIDPYWFPGRETTGTSAFIYGIAIGIQLGILDPVLYMPVIEKGLAQLLGMRHTETVVTPQTQSIFWGGIPQGRMGYMQSVGFHAYSYFDEAHVRYRSSAFGYGLFIHALAAVLRMTHDYNQVWFRVPPDSQKGVWVSPEYLGVVGSDVVARMQVL